MEGAPLAELPVQLVVEQALPLASGALFLGLGEAPVALASYGATFLPAPPFLTEPFTTGADGVSPPLLAQEPVDPLLCGVETVVQAVIFDPVATGGVAFTHAVRVRFGGPPAGPVLPGAAYPVGESPRSVAVGHLDGDDAPDLAIANLFSSDVSVLLNFGDGVFRDELRIESGGNGAYGIAVGDLNQDTEDDIVVSNVFSSEVAVLLGAGDGTFAPPACTPVAASPASLAIGDFNGDGLPDVAVVNQGANQVTVLPGLGDGSFDSALTSGTGFIPVDTVHGLAVGDLTGDGILDLALPLAVVDSIAVLRGVGDGTFLSLPSVSLAEAATSLAAADLNGDGALDLCAGSFNAVVTLLGAGDGSFVPLGEFAAGEFVAAVATADLDGDGDEDVAFVDRTLETIAVMPGSGDGTLGVPVTYAAGAFPAGLAVADLDGDLLIDVAAVSEFSGDATALLGVGDGELGGAAKVPVGQGTTAVAIADLDGDSIPDLVASNELGDSLLAFQGLGAGEFGPPSEASAGDAPQDLVVVDLDGDLVPDAVTANVFSDDISVFLGTGGGGFAAEQRYGPVGSPRALIGVDLTEDGLPDIAVANFDGHTVDVFRSLGDGTLAPPAAVPGGLSPQDLVAADFNVDGTLDLLVGGAVGPRVLLGTGGGSFSAPELYEIGSTQVVAVGELNDDGAPDAVGGRHLLAGDGEIVVFHGLGDGTLTQVQTYPVVSRPDALELADLNGDLVTDLVVGLPLASGTAGYVELARGIGDGTLLRQRRYYAGSRPEGLAIGDLNGDLLPDVVAADKEPSDGSLTLLTNQLFR
ncbi:MAG: VCBS repeat-containing protein [Planctomycetota bacterium]